MDLSRERTRSCYVSRAVAGRFGGSPGLAALIGIPLGITLHLGRFVGRAPATLLVNAGMGIPPVLVGLLLTLVLWRTGPVGSLGLLYTPAAMVTAHVIVALPLLPASRMPPSVCWA